MLARVVTSLLRKRHPKGRTFVGLKSCDFKIWTIVRKKFVRFQLIVDCKERTVVVQVLFVQQEAIARNRTVLFLTKITSFTVVSTSVPI